MSNAARYCSKVVNALTEVTEEKAVTTRKTPETNTQCSGGILAHFSTLIVIET